MDVPREGVAAKKRKRRILIISASAVGLILATIALSRLKPAAPSVDRSSVWIDTVKRGPMVRQVRGLGTLVPEEFRWLPTTTEASVEKILIWPGTEAIDLLARFNRAAAGVETSRGRSSESTREIKTRSSRSVARESWNVRRPASAAGAGRSAGQTGRQSRASG